MIVSGFDRPNIHLRVERVYDEEMKDQRLPSLVRGRRALVYAAENSQARLVESYVAPEGAHSFTNAVTDIVAGEGAVVEHCRIQREGQGTFHIGQTRVEIGRSASVASHAVSMGARLARLDAAKPVRYALEMNQGWFAKRGLKSGAKLQGEPWK